MYKFNTSCITTLPIHRHLDLSHGILSLPRIIEHLCNMHTNLDFACHAINWLGQTSLHFSVTEQIKNIYKNTCNNISNIKTCLDHSNTTLSKLEGNYTILDIMKLPSSICSHDNGIADNSTTQVTIDWQCEALPNFDYEEETVLNRLPSAQSIQRYLCSKALKASYNCTISKADHVYQKGWIVYDRSSGGNICSDSYNEYKLCNVHNLRKYLADTMLSTVYSVLQGIQEFCSNNTENSNITSQNSGAVPGNITFPRDDTNITIWNNNGTIPSDETTPHNLEWLWFIIPVVPVVAVSTALLIRKYCHKPSSETIIYIKEPASNRTIEYEGQQYSVRKVLLNGVNSKTLLPDEDALQSEQPNRPHTYVNIDFNLLQNQNNSTSQEDGSFPSPLLPKISVIPKYEEYISPVLIGQNINYDSSDSGMHSDI